MRVLTHMEYMTSTREVRSIAKGIGIREHCMVPGSCFATKGVRNRFWTLPLLLRSSARCPRAQRADPQLRAGAPHAADERSGARRRWRRG